MMRKMLIFLILNFVLRGSDAAPVTFSSGAPGAAQETKPANGSTGGGAVQNQNGTPAAMSAERSLLAAAATAVLGLVAFASTLL